MIYCRWKRLSPVKMQVKEGERRCIYQLEKTSMGRIQSRGYQRTVIIFSASFMQRRCRSAPMRTSKPYSYWGCATMAALKQKALHPGHQSPIFTKQLQIFFNTCAIPVFPLSFYTFTCTISNSYARCCTSIAFHFLGAISPFSCYSAILLPSPTVWNTQQQAQRLEVSYRDSFISCLLNLTMNYSSTSPSLLYSVKFFFSQQAYSTHTFRRQNRKVRSSFSPKAVLKKLKKFSSTAVSFSRTRHSTSSLPSMQLFLLTQRKSSQSSNLTLSALEQAYSICPTLCCGSRSIYRLRSPSTLSSLTCIFLRIIAPGVLSTTRQSSLPSSQRSRNKRSTADLASEGSVPASMFWAWMVLKGQQKVFFPILLMSLCASSYSQAAMEVITAPLQHRLQAQLCIWYLQYSQKDSPILNLWAIMSVLFTICGSRKRQFRSTVAWTHFRSIALALLAFISGALMFLDGCYIAGIFFSSEGQIPLNTASKFISSSSSMYKICPFSYPYGSITFTTIYTLQVRRQAYLLLIAPSTKNLGGLGRIYGN